MNPGDGICPRCLRPMSSRQTTCSKRCEKLLAKERALLVGSSRIGVIFGHRQPIPNKMLRAVYKRNGSRCHLCGEPVDLYTREPRMNATVDHLIPRSQGGDNSIGNLALAHRHCNSKRGRMGPAQLAFGVEV